MPDPTTVTVVAGTANPIEGKGDDVEISKEGVQVLDTEITAVPTLYDSEQEKDDGSEDVIIVTGADAAAHLLPLRDDGEPALTFRSIFLASGLSAFQAIMYQIYNFKPTFITIQGTFIVLIAYFLGKAWAAFLPRGDRLEARWRGRGGVGKPPRWISVISFFNHGPWSLKEHAVCAITATSASNAAASTMVFAAQDLFYDLPLSATTVILSTISIGLFGYGIAGIMRPIAVWHVDSVYWSTLPTVKTLQGLHWQDLKNSKPLRFFWYAFGGMFVYEFFPAYIFPFLNSISIPCLAAMHATGSKAAALTSVFGGSINNEGMGLFNFSFDWQYITSFQTSLPLKLQANAAAGFLFCYIAMVGIYYTNGWDSKSLPFMSTRLLSEDGTSYPIAKVFVGGVLDKDALARYGIPRLTGTFAYAMFMANAAIGALIAHCILFWGKDIAKAYKSARKGSYDDRHHAYMAKHYKETPWWWYIGVLIFSFVLGLVVIIKENITLPVWGYIVSLLLGIAIAPFSTILYARYGNGIATNNLSKMLAGLMLPGRPVGNMYFAAWSHNVINNTVNLCNDLKMGEYLKIPSRVMFLTQIYGTILGGFINYAMMIAIVTGNRELLVDGNGDSSWSGATIQSFNTNAASWALAKYLYQTGTRYSMVPIGLAIGAGAVVIHRIVIYFIPNPNFKGFPLSELNLPQFIQYAGYIPYNQSQTCVIWSQIIAGFFTQFYLRNYRPRIFKDYSYLVTGAFDGASLTVLFILSFAVFGAGGPAVPFPSWWGNNTKGNYDFCPIADISDYTGNKNLIVKLLDSNRLCKAASPLVAAASPISEGVHSTDFKRPAEPDAFLAGDTQIMAKKSNKSDAVPDTESSTAKTSFGRAWFFEILASTISVIALVVIVLLLHVYDGQPIPLWLLGITINTLLQLFPILAAIILLTSALTSTLTLATLATRNLQAITHDGFATTGKSTTLSKAIGDGTSSSINGLMLVPMVMSAISLIGNQTSPRLSATCSTGNCRWGTFDSLALCAAMNDVSGLLHDSEPEASLPNGLSLSPYRSMYLPHQLIQITSVKVNPFGAELTDEEPPPLSSANDTMSFGNRSDLFNTGLYDVSLIFLGN
ncbi:hypothetical protein B7463_g10629, partial [Scytalidium lignicola]